MMEDVIEQGILDKLRQGNYPATFEKLKFYGQSDIQNIYNQAEAKLGSVGSAVLVRVDSESRLPGTTGTKFMQVAYTISVVLAARSDKMKRNSNEPRLVYDLKKAVLQDVCGKTETLNNVVRGIEYTDGSNISIDDRIDLYLMNLKTKANYTLE